jgi:hypothetical protein
MSEEQSALLAVANDVEAAVFGGLPRELLLEIFRLARPRSSFVDGRACDKARHLFVSLWEAGGTVDAAMMMVPPEHTVQLSDWDHERLREMGPWQAIVLPLGARGGMQSYTFSNRCDHAATPGTALLAAALRANASLTTPTTETDQLGGVGNANRT